MYTIQCPKCNGEGECDLCKNTGRLDDSRGTLEASCLQDNLVKYLNILSKVKVLRSTLPVLEGVLVATVNGRLALTRTNLTTGIRAYCGARIDQDGAFVADFETLHTMVNKLSPERIDLKLNRRKNELSLDCGASHLDIAGFDPLEYPVVQKLDASLPALTVNVSDLVRALQETLPSVSGSDERPVLNAVHFDCYGDMLNVVATDGIEMTVSPITLSEKIAPSIDPFKVTINAESLSVLVSILKVKEYQADSISLTLVDNFAVFSWGNIELFGFTIDGTYPDWRSVVGVDEYDLTATTNAAEMLVALDRASVIAKHHKVHKPVKMTVLASSKQGVLHVEAWYLGKGHYDGILSAECNHIAHMEFGANVERLAQAIKRLDGQKVTLHINRMDKMFKVTVSESQSKVLLMPVDTTEIPGYSPVKGS